MSSPLFNALGNGSNMPAPLNQAMQLKQAFEQFRQSFTGGDPQQKVMELVQSGAVSQQQLNQAQQMAQQMQWLIGSL